MLLIGEITFAPHFSNSDCFDRIINRRCFSFAEAPPPSIARRGTSARFEATPGGSAPHPLRTQPRVRTSTVERPPVARQTRHGLMHGLGKRQRDRVPCIGRSECRAIASSLCSPTAAVGSRRMSNQVRRHRPAGYPDRECQRPPGSISQSFDRLHISARRLRGPADFVPSGSVTLGSCGSDPKLTGVTVVR